MLPGDRAYTNPFSNALVLSEEKMGIAFNTMANMQLPLICAPQFMHETTHHWCYSSPVGYAISFLGIKAKKKAYNIGFGIERPTDDNINSIKDANFIAKAFLEIVQPIFEGLALFAEHDVVTGDSTIITVPSIFLSMFFLGRQVAPEERIPMIPEILLQSRLKKRHIQNKANLLIQSLDCEDGGYLPGYLLVKNLRSLLLGKYFKFWDADLFLNYLKCYFFDDWGIVALLLKEGSNYDDILENVIEYIQKRLYGLLHDDLADSIKNFEEDGFNRKSDNFLWDDGYLHLEINSFPILSDSVSTGKNSMKNILNQIFERTNNQVSQDFLEISLQMMVFRTSITLAYGNFRVVVSKSKRVQLYHELFDIGTEMPVASFPEQDQLPVGYDKVVQVSLIAVLYQGGVYVFIHDGGATIFAFNMSELNYVVPGYLVNDFADLRERELLESSLQENVNNILTKSDNTYQVYKDILDRNVKIAKEDIYLKRWSALYTPDNLMDRFKNMMRIDGFMDVFEGDTDLIVDIAAISLCLSLKRDPASVLKDYKISLPKFEDVIDRANSLLLKEGGYKAFKVKDHLLYSYI